MHNLGLEYHFLIRINIFLNLLILFILKTLICVLLSIININVWAQSPTVKLIDENTRKAIPGVNIHFQSLESDKQYRNISDKYGIVDHISNEKCMITISSMGYKTLVDTLRAKQSKVYELEPDYFNLEQVTVTGTRTEKLLKDVPVLTHVITSEQLEMIDATDIQDALSIALPNIEFSKSSTGRILKMQGLEAKYILFLLDGEKIAGETNGNIDYERFNSYNIERIEIIKGAASSLYGSNAIAGVVNIITKKTKNKIEGNTGSRYSILNSSGKNYAEFDFNTSVGVNFHKISSRTDFHLKKNEGFVFNYDPENESKKYFLDPYNTHTISQKFQYKPTDKISVELKGNYYERDREDTYLMPPVYKTDKQFSYGLKTTYLPFEDVNIAAAWYSDNYETYYIDKFYDDKETLTYANRYDNARLTGNIKLWDKQLLSLGTEYINDNLYSNRIEGDEKQANNYVAFLQDDINFSKKFNSVVGFRFNWHSVYNFHFVPKISFMYKLPFLNLRANYGLGFKAPTLKELYMDFSPVPIVEVYGNPDLKPETSYYYSASVEFIKTMINSSVSLYQNRVTNMITEVQDIENPVIWTYKNINDVIISGIDFSFRAKIKHGFSITAGYSYTDSEDTSIGQQLIGSSKNSAVLILGHKSNIKNYKLTVNLQSKYIDKMSYEEMDDITGDVKTEYFKAHSMWKITTTHTLFEGICITLGVDNIFNYTEIQNITSINPGRSFFMGANIYFHKLNF